jgi:hypothetical protein
MTRTTLAWLGLVVLAGVVGDAGTAEACSFASNQPLVIDPQAQASDSTPPSPPSVGVESITRGKGPQPAGCGQSVSSCDDIGWIVLTVDATDDQTASAGLGYQVELVAGDLPAGLALPNGPVLPREGRLLLVWTDGASDDQEAISFTLALRAVDLAGNVGQPTTVQINDPGSGGCSIAARRPGSSWPASTLVVLLAARLLRRRRQARARIGKRPKKSPPPPSSACCPPVIQLIRAERCSALLPFS